MKNSGRSGFHGFGSHITRRDFVNGIAIGAGAALSTRASSIHAQAQANIAEPWLESDWYGYGGVGDYRLSHGNTPEVVAAAHRLRDREHFARVSEVEITEEYDLVIVGTGVAGLGAALEFVKSRKPDQTCLMLDNHPIFGGESKENEFNVNSTRLIAPQGANGFFIPLAVDNYKEATGDSRYYAELNIPREFSYRDWPGERKPLNFCADNYGYLVRGLQDHTSVGHFFNGQGTEAGQWAVDMWRQQLDNTPLKEKQRSNLMHWYGLGATKKFASDEQAMKALDVMSYETFLTRELGLGPEAARKADLFLASGAGLGSDATSAYAAYKLPMPGLADIPPAELRRTSFPGGNSGFVRHFLKRLIPDAIAGEDRFEHIINGRINFQALDRAGQPLRIRQSATVLNVQHVGSPETADHVKLVYTMGGQYQAVKAKSVVMATGGWINRHVVRDLPEKHLQAYQQFKHAPFLVANVALTNWRFLYKLGITAAIWDRVEGDFGYTCNIRTPMQVGDYQPPLDPDQPTVLSFYTPFYYPGLPLDAQIAKGRAELLYTSYADYEQKIVAQMLKLFGAAGFAPEKDIAGIILNRWGHAYSVPYPGFYGGASGTAPRDILRKSYGRIAFGHSELDGLQHYGPAADEGRRAFAQVWGAV